MASEGSVERSLAAMRPDRAGSAQGGATDLGLYGAPPTAFALEAPKLLSEAASSASTLSAPLAGGENASGSDGLFKIGTFSSHDPSLWQGSLSAGLGSTPIALLALPKFAQAAVDETAGMAMRDTSVEPAAAGGPASLLLIEQHAAGLKQAIADLQSATADKTSLTQDISPIIAVQQQAADVIGTMTQLLGTTFEAGVTSIEAVQPIEDASPLPLGLADATLSDLVAPVLPLPEAAEGIVQTPPSLESPVVFGGNLLPAETASDLIDGIEISLSTSGSELGRVMDEMADSVGQVAVAAQALGDVSDQVVGKVQESLAEVAATADAGKTAVQTTANDALDTARETVHTALDDASAALPTVSAIQEIVASASDTLDASLQGLGAPSEIVEDILTGEAAANLLPGLPPEPLSDLAPAPVSDSASVSSDLSSTGDLTAKVSSSVADIFAGNDPDGGIQTLTSLVSVADVLELNDNAASPDLGLADALGTAGTLDLLAPLPEDALLGVPDLLHHDDAGLHGFDLGLA